MDDWIKILFLIYAASVVLSLLATASTYNYLKNTIIVRLLFERQGTKKIAAFRWGRGNELTFFLINATCCFTPILNIFYGLACLKLTRNKVE